MFFGLLISERRFSFFIKIMKIQIRNLTVRDSKFRDKNTEIIFRSTTPINDASTRCISAVLTRTSNGSAGNTRQCILGWKLKSILLNKLEIRQSSAETRD